MLGRKPDVRGTAEPIRSERYGRFAGSAAVSLLLAPLMLSTAGCDGTHAPSLARAQIEARLQSVVPSGWSIVERIDGAPPYGIGVAPAQRQAFRKLTLVGPERIMVSGYYCKGGSFCPQPIASREALELWLAPEATARTAGDAAMTTRGASVVASGHGWTLFALTSRYNGKVLDFNGGFTDSSSETSRLPKASSDLPLSWKSWRSDLAGAMQ